MTPAPAPPRLAATLVGLVVRPPLAEHLLGDLEEQFHANVPRLGLHRARRRYWRQTIAMLWHRPDAPASSAEPAPKESRMTAALHDLRFAARLLARRPSYAAIAILSLALAIGANGTVYGLVNALLFSPFDFPDPARLVSIGSAYPKIGADENFIEQHSSAEIEDFAQARSLDRMGAFDLGNRVLSNGTDSDRVFTALILIDPIPALGVPLTLGRGFTAEELAPNGPRVAILSHRLWVSWVGSDRAIIGKAVRMNTEPLTVVGVLGEGPTLLGTDLWIPWGGDRRESRRNYRPFSVVARLAPGATLAQLNTELATIATRTATTFQGQFPEYAGWTLRAAPWNEAISGRFLPAGYLLLAAGALVLLIACVNLASLLLARLSARQRELAVRRALGASGWQVTRLLLAENLIVAGLASALGVALTMLTLRAIPLLLPSVVLSIGFEIGMDMPVVAYCAIAGLVAAGLTTLLPAWHARRTDPHQTLKDSGHAGGSPARQRARRALIVAEVALAVVLLVNAGLFLRSYSRIQQIDPGFNPTNVLTMRLTIDNAKYPGEAATTFFDQLTERLATLPGVAGVAAASQFPPNEIFTMQFDLDAAADPKGTLPNALVTVTTPGLFDVMDMPLQSGRALASSDRIDTPAVVVVNEAFARRFLNGQSSGRLRLGRNRVVADVVGVVADTRNASLVAAPAPEMFMTVAQAGGGNNQLFLLIRSERPMADLLAAVRREIAVMDPNQPVYLVQTMEQAMAASVFPQRIAMLLVAIFAAGAIILSTIGVYGLVSFWVATRTREIGIRLALGGTARQVVGLVMRQTAGVLGIGAVIGLLAGVGSAYAATSLLYGTQPADPATIAMVIVVLALTGLAAASLPARRALDVDPIAVLRAE